jgi:ribosomal protein S6--L-glutamate ligase
MADFVLGWEEWLSLPELGLPSLLAKTDTGARTSALHAFAVEPFGPVSRPRVRFVVQPWPERPDVEVVCSAPLVDRREVTSSNGEPEMRYIIRTPIRIGDRKWEADISLTNRQSMRYRMLLGRRALDETVLIDPSRSFVQQPLSYDVYGAASRPAVKRPLRIALLTQEPKNYSCRRLIEAAEARDHVIETIETRRCAMNINAERPAVHYDSQPLPRFDAVIPRIGASITSYGCAVVRQFAMTGAYCLNGADAIAASRDKLSAHQMLARFGVGMPVTVFASAAVDVDHAITLVGGAPLVVKLLKASQGRGTVLADSALAARSVIGAFQDLDAHILIQEFVAEAKGADIRLIVLGGKVVAAMRRQAKAGEFRSNLHRGGHAELIKPTKEERETALKAARILGLEACGVDLLRSDSGPKVLEVNSSPGLEGVEAATGEDIAKLMIDHIEKRCRPTLRRKRGPLAIAA